MKSTDASGMKPHVEYKFELSYVSVRTNERVIHGRKDIHRI